MHNYLELIFFNYFHILLFIFKFNIFIFFLIVILYRGDVICNSRWSQVHLDLPKNVYICLQIYIYIYMCVCVCVCVCVRTKKSNDLTPHRTVSYTVKLWPKSIEFVRE